MTDIFDANLRNVALNYLKLMKIKVDKTLLLNLLQESPYFPTLFSLSKTYSYFEIPNKSYRIPASDAIKMQPPFIAYITSQQNRHDFILVTSIKDNSVNYIADSAATESMHVGEFLKVYSGVLFFASKGKDEKSGSSTKLRRPKLALQKGTIFFYVLLIAASILILIPGIVRNALLLNYDESISFFCVAVLKILGLTIVILTLFYENNRNNPFLKKVCNFGYKINCRKVLDSNAAKLLGLSWTEFGLFYFVSSIFILCLPVTFHVTETCMAIFNFFASPFVIFSLYYQWKIIKNWCVLCLCIQGILLSELIWGIISYWQSPFLPEIGIYSAAMILFCLLFPVAAWLSIKGVLSEARQAEYYRIAFKQLKFNPSIFNSLLFLQPIAPDGFDKMGISLGNSNASNLIIKVCDPYCSPCQESYKLIEDLLKNNNIQIKILFHFTDDEEEPSNIIASRLLDIDAAGDDSFTRMALDDWFLNKEKDHSAFMQKYQNTCQVKKQDDIVIKMKKWCQEAEISSTPTYYINGRRLPDEYKIDEVKYVL